MQAKVFNFLHVNKKNISSIVLLLTKLTILNRIMCRYLCCVADIRQ